MVQNCDIYRLHIISYMDLWEHIRCHSKAEALDIDKVDDWHVKNVGTDNENLFLLVFIGTGNDDFSEGGFHQRCGPRYVSEDYSTHAT
jgi:hypothetical protein